MPVTGLKSFLDKWWPSDAQSRSESITAPEAPRTGELFGAEQLARHARNVAEEHDVGDSSGPELLLSKLREDEQIIRQTCKLLSDALSNGLRLSPAAEWLLDNFYLVEEQIALTRQHLPRDYSLQLPRLLTGPSAGVPRVYDIAIELISHTDGRFDEDDLARFITAYQKQQQLRLGELWAVPIMVRLALINSVRYVAQRLGRQRRQRDQATTWARRFIDLARNEPKKLIVALADLVTEGPQLSRAFVAELTIRLQGRHPSLGLVLQWLEHELAEKGLSIEQVLLSESQITASDQASISNSILGLRAVASVDWSKFVESHAIVEVALKRDPRGVYGEMDFETRDSYRHVIERLRLRCSRTELQIAEAAVGLARQAAEESDDPRRSHVGYYLVDAGRLRLENEIHYRPSWWTLIRRGCKRHAGVLYTSCVILLMLVFAGPIAHWALRVGTPPWMLGAIAVPLLLLVSQTAIALANWLATRLAHPRMLPRMDYFRAIPEDRRTVMAIPTMLTSRENARELIETLEVRYLANRDPQFSFALLTDYADAPGETLSDDQSILEEALAGIDRLNRKYPRAKQPFFLFHRPRIWCKAENAWMGRERKRGKVTDFNTFLAHGDHSPFSTIAGDLDRLKDVRYVIILDTDTQLPPQSAWKLVGTMSHPLNTPHIDERRRIVTRGYGLLQPRVAASLTSGRMSRYAALMAGEVGIDPYTREVSDLYQDLFDEASFIGKGIFDVHAFDACLRDRLPDNTILSHDLLEGCYTRCGFVSDVELIEDQPARYTADVSRHHRWIRGDWQIIGWMLGLSADRRLSVLSRWKMFDNLRRSLLPPATLAMFALAWLMLPGHMAWTLITIGLVLLPRLWFAVTAMLNKRQDSGLRLHLAQTGRKQLAEISQVCLRLIFLPYEAMVYLDAIGRTFWRKLITRRHLLQWRTAADTDRNASTSLTGVIGTMAIAPLITIALGLIIWIERPWALPSALPLLVAWFACPLPAWWLSQPLLAQRVHLSARETRFVRTIARRTWHFYERFVNDRTQWLPPDNYQEKPVARLAERTSPTNIGLSALCGLAAWDFGFLSGAALLERTSRMFNTMDTMPRHRGHFFNWYRTDNLEPLPPRFVSTVDSGNMAMLLVTLSQGLADLATHTILPPHWLDGLRDTARVLHEELVKLHTAPDAGEPDPALTELERWTAHFASRTIPAPTKLAECHTLLSHVSAKLDALSPTDSDGAAPSEVTVWYDMLCRQCGQLIAEIEYFIPWPIPTDEQLEQLRQVLIKLGEEPTHVDTLIGQLRDLPRVDDMARLQFRFGPMLRKAADHEQAPQWASTVSEHAQLASDQARHRMDSIAQMRLRSRDFATADYTFLYNPRLKLFSLGYHADRHQLDVGHYDLLATEARQASFFAIAQNQVPIEHWFHMRRSLTPVGNRASLVSWSGSMFEYLMPLLIMPTFGHTLLDETYHAAVKAQIQHGQALGIPWGVSESGYNLVDGQMNYQYRAFGVPALGLNRGLTDDRVVAPYASELAMMIRPHTAIRNLQLMARRGLVGSCGLYEAVDYTPRRLPEDRDHMVVESFMVHHCGMGFLGMAYALLGQPMQRRFTSDPEFRSALLLLQERVPSTEPVIAALELQAQESEMRTSPADAQPIMRTLNDPNTPAPQVALLGNGRYHVMVSNAGGGYSRWNDLSLTRWRADRTRDHWGQFCYVRDIDRGNFWSNAYQPTQRKAENYQAIFSQGRVEFIRTDDQIETHTQISVSPEDDVEVRRVKVHNLSRTKRRIELTTHGEVVLANQMADISHRVFSNLFVESGWEDNRGALVFTRRSRDADDKPPMMFHLTTCGGEWSQPTFETDREAFIGRGRTAADPAAMEAGGELAGGCGATLDPIMAIRRSVTLEPGQWSELIIVTGAAEDRQGADILMDKYCDRRQSERAYETAWTHNQVLLQQLGAASSDTVLFNRLASPLIYPDATFRAAPSIIARNRQGQPGLWGQSISGDLPVILLTVCDLGSIDLIVKIAQAHIWWRAKGLRTDLVILVEESTGHRQQLIDQITGHLNATPEASYLNKSGGVYVRNVDTLSEDERTLLQAAARLTLHDRAGSLFDQAERMPLMRRTTPALKPSRSNENHEAGDLPRRDHELLFHNGIGGFTKDGKEYVIRLEEGRTTPAPWCNVIASSMFGTVISESGSAYTWAENSHEFRLTPWRNDIVSDAGGEAFYIRDESNGQYWSPSPAPARGEGPYICRHGLGYTIHEHDQSGIYSEMTTYVATDAPVKFVSIKLRNHSGRPRKLSVTGYIEWVLGDYREKTGMHIVTRLDSRTGGMLASNSYNTEFPDRVAFAHCFPGERTYTADRTEFIGRNGSLASPAAMSARQLSNRMGAALDACSALQSQVEIPSGEERQVVFIVGAGTSEPHAIELLQKFRGSGAARQSLEAVWQQWNRMLGAVYVETPDPALNVMLNYWTMYQAIACRFWGRSGFYQSGGAFGFRDQLQDAMAMLHNAPWLLREQILRCAGRQFREGDVQHWWHPPSGRGVRTHFADDYLWLPYAVARYVRGTGDIGVLNESLPFLEGRPVGSDEESYYDLPRISHDQASLYEHCTKAIERAMSQLGERGLPLMGSGDWNDGMNKVGEKGQGESVWMAFFLYDILTQFQHVTGVKKDDAFAQRCAKAAEQLKAAIDEHGWDGQWYRRAYYDDGTPLGSAENDECRIDSLSQSWAVISGAGIEQRAEQAMRSLNERLVRDDLHLIQLLDPAFDKTPLNPGYIKGYVPGVRENGGQYTHAAVWATIAMALRGDAKNAWKCFGYLNPIHHSDDKEKAAIYKVEPYVIVADIYTNPQHPGRGGWTWYTGAAGWTFRLMFETLLGVTLEVNKLTFAPVLPADWKEYRIYYRYRDTSYNIHFRITGPSTANVKQVSVDGQAQQDKAIRLTDDRKPHYAEVELG